MTSLMPGRTSVRFALIAIAVLTLISAANAQGTKTTVYQVKEAGVQIDLPSGWEASKDPNGTQVISKKDADGYVLFALNVLPSDRSMTIDALYAAFSESIFENAKKDWKAFKAEAILKGTQDGMATRAQKFDGSMESAGGELEGLVIVLDSAKPLGIFAQRTKKHSDVLEKESSDIVNSIKKIQ